MVRVGTGGPSTEEAAKVVDMIMVFVSDSVFEPPVQTRVHL